MDAVTTIHGEGSAEQAWQHCDWLWRQPACSVQRLCGDAARIVVIAPHPDDEILGCGGLLHAAVERGVEVQVVAVTDGEACYPDEVWWTPARLRQARRQELRAALAELAIGADAIRHLGIADGGVSHHEHGLQDWLQQNLRSTDLVLAPWRFDGHPDHEAAGRAALGAADAVGCTRLEYPVWGWHWLDPASVHLAWKAPRLLDISDAVDRKRRAIARFRTQLGAVDQLRAAPILPAHVLARFYRTHEVFLA
ncbi:PIG-L deacetylase family protein [Stenotrophomonas maltophilia]|uniref:PIG-L deacetylase family protein n=1 Tax=Stenotrophomonas maltophilia TaxID=40324 RepID=UPI0034DADC37